MSVSAPRIHGQQKLTHIGVTKNGTKTVTGNSSKLKKSAAYTIEFGLAIANLITPGGDPDPSPESRLHIREVHEIVGTSEH